jgi:hypothetical protein
LQIINSIAWKLYSEAPVGRLPVKKVLCQHMLKINKNPFDSSRSFLGARLMFLVHWC